MTRVSIELVPRSYPHLESECSRMQQALPFIDTVNIPDLLRMPITSWDACRFTNTYFQNNIPHLRAIDFDLGNPQQLEHAIAGFPEVLVVSGDPPQGFARKVFATRCCQVIEYIKSHHPDKRVIAGIDPYRQSLREEMAYIQQKIVTGADAFFTQPFFSLHLMDAYFELLSDHEVFWGVSPVVGEKSKNYWEYTNRVVFPPDYCFTLAGNQRFARSVMSFVRERDSNIYFMPIRTDTVAYLEGVL